MLKISVHAGPSAAGTVLRLEGRVAGEWLGELRRVCRERCHPSAPLTIDLHGVTFIDHDGVAFFGEVSSHVTLINCSLFAAEQLRPVLARHDPER